MSINTNDFSKQNINYSVNTDHRTAEEFTALRQANAKVVQNMTDTAKSDSENKDSRSFASSVKIEPREIEAANEKMSQLNVQLTFEMTEEREQNIVKVLDQTTGDVVRQIPTEDFLKMSERIDAIMDQLTDIKGTLVNSEA
ncbi:flagellar protein FlaG [Marinomonas colpomeniae]|uniref:Flagellar protein FlaG n=1 Tax=Marinomonas colpomeniae TaxID=2774408 RepID=A0ABR8NW83_9GAMM|nr:flagellar protein FlaG [Marinomonas colpomeniae]MBD5769749.1 flagellar protein FlaG [Marinomonas colpomeniae]